MWFRKRKPEDSREEIERILARLDAPETVPAVAWQVGDAVVARAGPFKGMKGKVVAVRAEHHALHTSLDIFGRQTPVELHFDDAERPLPKG
jgi:transcription termination/antitermination protein NusG